MEFGGLTAHRLVRESRSNRLAWECSCSCGGKAVIVAYRLFRGVTKSCGCLSSDKAAEESTKGPNAYVVDGDVVRVSLENASGKVAAETIVSLSDLEMIISRRWHLVKGYVGSSPTVSGLPRVLMHRVLLNAPKDLEVDHINGDPLDNRRSNLRLATRSENMRNITKARAKSGYKGVYPTREGRWLARVVRHGVVYHAGTFSDPRDAARAYNREAIELFGEFAALNVLPEENQTIIRDVERRPQQTAAPRVSAISAPDPFPSDWVRR